MSATILCIDDERDLLDTLRRLLARAGHKVLLAPGGEAGLAALAHDEPDLIITDLMMPGVDGMQILDRARAERPDTPVILITAFATLQTAIEAIRRGAWDYVAKPFTHEQLLVVVDRALEHRRLQSENKSLKRQIEAEEDTGGILGASTSTRMVVEMVRKVAPTDLSVLITGESGTGKEVVARAVHRLSRRKQGPFVPVDCGAIPHNLMESELFGHEKGAFTGATSSRSGLVEAANQGTFFLDEIGELDAGVQAKLLRLLQEGEYRPVGGNRIRSSNIRVVAATNRDLDTAIRQGTFREDLYHRLNVVQIRLAPLRDRPEDIPALMNHFLQRFSTQEGRTLLRLAPSTAEVLQEHRWPGNVRELQNCCRYLAGLAEGPVVHVSDLPPALRHELGERIHRPAVFQQPSRDDIRPGTEGVGLAVRHDLSYKAAKRLWLEHFERVYILALLEGHAGNISHAARTAGIDRKSIQRLMKRNDIPHPSGETFDDSEDSTEEPNETDET